MAGEDIWASQPASPLGSCALPSSNWLIPFLYLQTVITMSDFSLLSADMRLWDPSSKATWGSLNLCPMVMQFQVHTFIHKQLTTLSQAGAWGDAEKPHQDMAFILIATSLVVGCEWIFSLTAIWTQPCQVCLPTLADTTQKLMLPDG